MIFNCRESFENNVSKACILMAFETSWNCREIDENNESKARIVTVFETIWNCRKMKTMNLKHATEHRYPCFNSYAPKPVPIFYSAKKHRYRRFISKI